MISNWHINCDPFHTITCLLSNYFCSKNCQMNHAGTHYTIICGALCSTELQRKSIAPTHLLNHSRIMHSIRDLTSDPSALFFFFFDGQLSFETVRKMKILDHFISFLGHFDHFRQCWMSTTTTVQKDGQFWNPSWVPAQHLRGWSILTWSDWLGTCTKTV